LGLVVDRTLVDQIQGGQLPILHLVESREESEGSLSDSDDGGAQEQVYSDLSMPTQDFSKKGGSSQPRRPVKKHHKSSSKPPLPMVGAPLSRQIALKSMPPGRRRKAGDGGKKGSLKGQSIEAIPQQQQLQPLVCPSVSLPLTGANSADFELQVVLPFPGSGINHLADGDGGLSTDVARGVEGGRLPEVMEAAVLMGIQKEVGFNFDGGDEDVQRRLVQLEKKDREVNGERVQALSYQ
jgi:hypothetical protein